jgi:hypothetical protein
MLREARRVLSHWFRFSGQWKEDEAQAEDFAEEKRKCANSNMVNICLALLLLIHPSSFFV